ncbi:MAG TPA: hypothetical protein VJI46_03405 [Candidatus Nanoarchaeia archaeon]|nr:hypothetical protein [Candidatus Nanoarchaeia archaeon]
MVKIKRNLLNLVENAMILFLVVLGLFLAFQIFRKVFGGSWDTEGLILGMMFFNLSSVFTLAIVVAQLKSEVGHLRGQFHSLISDFKMLVKKVDSLNK